MSAQANIVINDGAATPVAQTFNPKGAKTSPTSKDVAIWRNQAVANAIGYQTIEEQHAAPNVNGLEKFRWVLTVPTTEIPAGLTAPRIAYAGTVIVEAWLPQRATDQELKNYAAYLKNFAALQYVQDAIIKRECAW